MINKETIIERMRKMYNALYDFIVNKMKDKDIKKLIVDLKDYINGSYNDYYEYDFNKLINEIKEYMTENGINEISN